MKLIKRKTLHYQKDASDKVYEVDLCEVAEDKYLVNFRYGRRGANLKEGTKTTQPVALTKAEQVFDKLVGEKTRKGYVDTSAASSVTTSQPVATVNNPRIQAILNRLADDKPSTWKLERAIWKAGELKVTDATPLLIDLLGTGKDLRDYCIAWALGWCCENSNNQDVIALLTKLYESDETADFVSGIAFEATLKICDEVKKAQLQAEAINYLPSFFQELLKQGSSDDFTTELKAYLADCDYEDFEILEIIYEINNEVVRPGLIEIISTAPFKPNYFQRIRHIFKVAEYRRDEEIFGILAYRFEKEFGNFDSTFYVKLENGEILGQNWSFYDYTTGRIERKTNQIVEEFQKPDSRIAYSNKTREYLRRRIWKTLEKLGQENNPDYVKLAVGVLLQYSDADAKSIQQSRSYSWSKGYINRHWDKYADYLAFNHILYENSPRYALASNKKAWGCKEGYKPGDAEPTVREEAFPQLWEQQPEALLKLLVESECNPVHSFAVKALRSCHKFLASINVDNIIKLVNKSYEVTAQLGFELALLNYDSNNPNKTLIIALANCLSERARNQAYKWIEEKQDYFLEDSSFITALILSYHSDTRQFAKRFLGNAIIPDSSAQIIIGKILVELLAIPPNPPLERGESEAGGIKELIKEASEILLLTFPSQLRSLNLNVINDLLSHPIIEIQEFGARILLNHQIPAKDLPAHIIESLLASENESLRILGIRLFGQLPDDKLIDEERELIIAIAINSNPEIRNAIKPVINRLAAANPNFTVDIASEFIEILLTKEKHEGLHSFLVNLLKELPGWMTSISRETTLKLLKTKTSAPQELGGLLLSANYQTWIEEFTTSEIVKLSNHEIAAVRNASHQMLSQILNRLRADSSEMVGAVRILEAKWQDSRDFAFELFTTEFTENEFTPEVLVTICDSVREEARRLGRDLLAKNFQSLDGEEYLLKFSEHPSADMQLFATNYLETYAKNDTAKLQQLAPFFISILSRVNRGSVAKKRTFAFLEAEAQKSEKAAKIVAEIMTRQSVTMAVADKSSAIQIMLKIYKQYPHLALPIEVKPVVEVRT
ncbi:MAG: WGR domain-containing protein [Rivularia sp. (in: Bacteria)]|nr:WGR domain-containing protein [Rivularia sp. MS3]